ESSRSSSDTSAPGYSSTGPHSAKASWRPTSRDCLTEATNASTSACTLSAARSRAIGSSSSGPVRVSSPREAGRTSPPIKVKPFSGPVMPALYMGMEKILRMGIRHGLLLGGRGKHVHLRRQHRGIRYFYLRRFKNDGGQQVVMSVLAHIRQ